MKTNVLNPEVYTTKEQRICPICGNEMTLDDIDYDFDGKQDEYYVCDKCDACVIYPVRYHKIFKRSIIDKEDNVVEERLGASK